MPTGQATATAVGWLGQAVVGMGGGCGHAPPCSSSLARRSLQPRKDEQEGEREGVPRLEHDHHHQCGRHADAQPEDGDRFSLLAEERDRVVEPEDLGAHRVEEAQLRREQDRPDEGDCHHGRHPRQQQRPRTSPRPRNEERTSSAANSPMTIAPVVPSTEYSSVVRAASKKLEPPSSTLQFAGPIVCVAKRHPARARTYASAKPGTRPRALAAVPVTGAVVRASPAAVVRAWAPSAAARADPRSGIQQRVSYLVRSTPSETSGSPPGSGSPSCPGP